MKLLTAIVFIVPALVSAAPPRGMDVSHYQSSINWADVKANGAEFVYIKATEEISYIDPAFNNHYIGATNVGIIRGGYHFARPAASSGADQANFFLDHGGGWSGDGRTLPGALDLEDGCSDLSSEQMVNWIRDFSETYKARTGRPPVIYTSTSWWTECTGNNGGFGENPLWLARWASSPGPVPNGWTFHTFWQSNDHGPLPGDQDEFNGDSAQLQRFARG